MHKATNVGRLSSEERKELVTRLLKSQNGLCYICNKAIDPKHDRIAIDRIRPRAQGGPNDQSNLGVVHDSCNRLTGSMPTHVDFQLLENALDFVLSAAEHAKKNTPRDLKYAILHIAAGIELLLKARLEKEHWSLLFANVDQADEASLRSGDFVSVDFKAAPKRLKGIAGIVLPETTLKQLAELYATRNKVQHLAIRIPMAQVRALVGQGHNFVLDFVKENLAKEAKPYEKEMKAIREQVAELEGFIAARLTAIKPQIDAANRLIECPRCLQETLEVGSDEPHCLYCEYECDWETLARERSETGEILRCPGCGEMSCTFVVFNNDDAGWYCLNCDVRYDSTGDESYTPCPRCGEGLVKGDGGMCSDCWHQVMSKDD